VTLCNVNKFASVAAFKHTIDINLLFFLLLEKIQLKQRKKS